MIAEGKYATFFLLLKFTLGLANSVPGSQRGALFNAASIFVVVESRKYPESYADLKETLLFTFQNTKCPILPAFFFLAQFLWEKKCRFIQK